MNSGSRRFHFWSPSLRLRQRNYYRLINSAATFHRPSGFDSFHIYSSLFADSSRLHTTQSSLLLRTAYGCRECVYENNTCNNFEHFVFTLFSVSFVEDDCAINKCLSAVRHETRQSKYFSCYHDKYECTISTFRTYLLRKINYNVKI